MPRLGEDPNVATAYPSRSTLNSSRCLRQFVTTALSFFLVLFIINKVFLTNYREATKTHMEQRGITEERITKVIPKTWTEIEREKKNAKYIKVITRNQIEALKQDVGNLTYSVLELQQALVNSTGVILKHPVVLPNGTLDAIEDNEFEDGAPIAAGGGDAGERDAHGGDSRQLMAKSGVGLMRPSWQRQLRGWKREGRKSGLGLAQQAP